MALSNIEKLRCSDRINLCMAAQYDYGNFGDLLSRYIVEGISGKSIDLYKEDNSVHFCAIGSLLERNEICSNTVVWGSGFLSPQPLWKIKLTYLRQLLRRKTGSPLYLAVRGKKTRDILINAGYECPEVYGDPALLMPILYNPYNITKTHKLGVVLHRKHKKYTEMFRDNCDIKIIDIDRKYSELESFIDDVLSCEYILSSSLHGLVIANAYRIPCVRLIFKNKPLGKSLERDMFKFSDYVSGLNSCKADSLQANYCLRGVNVACADIINSEIVDAVIKSATAPNFKIDLNKLVEKFPFLDNKYKKTNFCY